MNDPLWNSSRHFSVVSHRRKVQPARALLSRRTAKVVTLQQAEGWPRVAQNTSYGISRASQADVVHAAHPEREPFVERLARDGHVHRGSTLADREITVLTEGQAHEGTDREIGRDWDVSAELNVAELEAGRRRAGIGAASAHVQEQPFIPGPHAQPGVERLAGGEMEVKVDAEAEVAGRAADAGTAAPSIGTVVRIDEPKPY